MVVRAACPECGSSRYQQPDPTRHGKQHHQCQACDRQLVATAENPLIIAGCIHLM
jgi:transposase-like protein